ncbi:hypothetical protein [Vibrio comitans]
MKYIKSSLMLLVTGVLAGAGYGILQAERINYTTVQDLQEQICPPMTEMRYHNICTIAVSMTHDRLMD